MPPGAPRTGRTCRACRGCRSSRPSGPYAAGRRPRSTVAIWSGRSALSSVPNQAFSRPGASSVTNSALAPASWAACASSAGSAPSASGRGRPCPARPFRRTPRLRRPRAAAAAALDQGAARLDDGLAEPVDLQHRLAEPPHGPVLEAALRDLRRGCREDAVVLDRHLDRAEQVRAVRRAVVLHEQLPGLGPPVDTGRDLPQLPAVQGDLAVPVEDDLGRGEEPEPERVGAMAAAYVEEGVQAVRAGLQTQFQGAGVADRRGEGVDALGEVLHDQVGGGRGPGTVLDVDGERVPLLLLDQPERRVRDGRSVRGRGHDPAAGVADRGLVASPVTVVEAVPCAGTVSVVSARVTTPSGAPRRRASTRPPCRRSCCR